MSGAEAAMIAAGASLAGGLMEGMFTRSGAHSANAMARDNAREQMAFQERMSSTALQRMKLDAEKAGFNPLYYLKGGGASSPSGAAAPAMNPNEGFRGHSAKAVEAYMARKQLDQMDATIDNIKSQTVLNSAKTVESNKQLSVLQAQIDQIAANTGYVVTQDDVLKAQRGKFMLQNLPYSVTYEAINEAKRLYSDIQSGNVKPTYFGGAVKVRKKEPGDKDGIRFVKRGEK